MHNIKCDDNETKAQSNLKSNQKKVKNTKQSVNHNVNTSGMKSCVFSYARNLECIIFLLVHS